MKNLLKFLLLAGLGAGFGALFMILGGTILTSAGWAVMGTGSLLNIGLVGGAILFPIPLALLFGSLTSGNGDATKASMSLWQSSAPIAGLIGAAVFGATAGVQLGYVAASGAIGILVGVSGLVIAVAVIALLGAGMSALSTSGRSSGNYSGITESESPIRAQAYYEDHNAVIAPNPSLYAGSFIPASAELVSKFPTAHYRPGSEFESHRAFIAQVDAEIKAGTAAYIEESRRGMFPSTGFPTVFSGVHFHDLGNHYRGKPHNVRIEEVPDSASKLASSALGSRPLL